MARKAVIVAAVVTSLVMAVPVAQAAMAVIDGTAIGKAVEQLNELKRQAATQLEQLTQLKQSVSFLNDITAFTGDMNKAVGSFTSMSLPIPNIQRMAAQIKSDARCLMPDGQGWGIKTKDMNLGSICDMWSQYRTALFTDETDLRGLTAHQQDQARRLADNRRSELLADTATRALGHADVQLNQAAELDKAADGLQADLNAAATMQDRLHVQAQTGILLAHAMAAQNQTLAQILKLQAAVAIKMGLKPDAVAKITGEGGAK